MSPGSWLEWDSRALADYISPSRALFLRSPSVSEAHQSLQSSELVLSVSCSLFNSENPPATEWGKDIVFRGQSRICYNVKKMHLVQHAFLLGICVTPLCLQRWCLQVQAVSRRQQPLCNSMPEALRSLLMNGLEFFFSEIFRHGLSTQVNLQG